MAIPYQPGPDLEFLCIQKLDTAPFCENHAKLYFAVNHLVKGLSMEW